MNPPAAKALSTRAILRVYRHLVRRAAREVLQGRRVDPRRHEAGRFLRADVDAFTDDVWQRLERILSDAELEDVPTAGNRHNVLLGALTVAAHHALRDLGLDRDYAIELFADVGWRIYERMLGVPLFVARVVTRDPQRRMELVLRALLRFPFSAPGRPGYEVRAWSEPTVFHTDWTYCAPLGFVRRHVERHGDNGELEAFHRSWCLYDWAAADLLAGTRARGRAHYERKHTLSRGDPVCDMCWSACPGRAPERQEDRPEDAA